ncbi:MAG: hypothetical protein OHK0053_20620 [Microscillaceae bacterium]
MSAQEKLKNAQNLVYFKITYFPETHLVESEWIGFINDVESSKQAYLLMSEFLNQYRCEAILNSNKKQVGPWPKVDEWLAETWLPHMQMTGLKYFAHLHSRNLFTQVSAERAFANIPKGIFLEHFYEEEQARQWLLRQSNRGLRR